MPTPKHVPSSLTTWTANSPPCTSGKWRCHSRTLAIAYFTVHGASLRTGATREPLLQGGASRVAGVAEGSQVAPLKPQVGSLPDALLVVDIDGEVAATPRAAHRVGLEVARSKLAPVLV